MVSIGLMSLVALMTGQPIIFLRWADRVLLFSPLR
jgi:hypothetical protein